MSVAPGLHLELLRCFPDLHFHLGGFEHALALPVEFFLARLSSAAHTHANVDFVQDTPRVRELQERRRVVVCIPKRYMYEYE